MTEKRIRINEVPAWKVQLAYKRACRTQKGKDWATWKYLSKRRTVLLEEQRKKRR